MRNLLLCAALAVVSVSGMVACGDADTNSTSKRGGKGGAFADPYRDDDPGDATEVSPEDPSARSTPDAPTTAGNSTGAFTVAVDKNVPQVDIAAKTTINVTVTPASGFTGKVDLTAANLPAGVTATFTPATVDLAGGPATAKVEFASTITTVPTPAGVAATVHGVGEGATDKTADANITFKVNNAYEIQIPTNLEALMAAGATQELGKQFVGVKFTTGIAFTVRNNMSTPWYTHANGAANFIHGKGSVAPGQLEGDGTGNTLVRTIAVATNAIQMYEHGTADGTNCTTSLAVSAPAN